MSAMSSVVDATADMYSSTLTDGIDSVLEEIQLLSLSQVGGGVP